MESDTKIMFELLRDEAHSLFVKYDLYGWEFQFDKSRRRFGYCSYGKKIVSLSEQLVVLNFNYNFNQIMMTLLHEVAHAISYKRYGMRGAGHNYLWRQILLEIGGDGRRLYDGSKVILPKMPKEKYVYKCPACEREKYVRRKLKRKYSCGKCSGGHWNEKFILELVEA